MGKMEGALLGDGSIDIQAYKVRVFSGRAFENLEHEQERKVVGWWLDH